MKRTLIAALGALALLACKQSVDDAVVALDDLPASYAAAVCENLGACCDDDFDVDDCKLAGEANARAAVEGLQSMNGAVYHSDKAVQCLQDTEASASRCEANFTTDCAEVFENVSSTADAGTPGVADQCEGGLF